jgi:hypothetical protein
VSPFGFVPQLVMLFAVPLSSSLQPILSCQATSFIPLRLPAMREIIENKRYALAGQSSLHSFQSLVSPPAAVFMLACGSLRAAGLSQFLYPQFAFLLTTVAKANSPTHKTKTPPAPCVCNIGRNRIRTSCSVAFTLSSTRGWLASQCPQSVPLRYTHCSHFSNRTAQGCITCVGFFSTHRKKEDPSGKKRIHRLN